MITVIPSSERYHADAGWLSTYWHFSFSDYYDPANLHWGALRVFNDDVIQGGGGFDLHPHRDMEIITYVLEGQLEHKDHLGNHGIIHPGEVQVMSAGRGIMHAEFNASKEIAAHLLQIWIMPAEKGVQPRWEQKQFTAAQREGKLLAVVSSGKIADTLRINQDAAVYVSKLNAGQQVELDTQPQRHPYLFVIDGNVTVNGLAASKGDQVRVTDEKQIDIRAEKNAELILLDVP
jgi:quercetin 2,3-dioxygenase